MSTEDFVRFGVSWAPCEQARPVPQANHCVENVGNLRTFAVHFLVDMRSANVTAALGLLALVGCADATLEASDPDSWDFPEWAGKADGLGSGLTSTRDPAVVVFDGYNHVADLPLGRNCVLPEPGELEFAPFRAGGDQFTSEFVYIQTREELEEALDIDAQASIKVGPLGGGGSLGISSKFKSSDKSLAILLRTRQVYTVVNQDRHNMTDEAIEMLRTDARQFGRECGTGYVAGVAYGAELTLLIQIEASTIEESKSIKSMLEAQGIKAGPASISPSLGTAFSSATSSENVTVSVDVEARGFVPSVDINSLAALDESAFAVAATAKDDLLASVANDKCHDQGDAGPGTCDDAPAKGYLANGARRSIPMGILHHPFQRTANFPGDQEVVDSLLEVSRAADEALATFRDYASLYSAMVGIHNDEVAAMLSSDAPYEYSAYDPSEDFIAMSFNDLQGYATDWARAYEPEAGTEVRKLADAVSDCWSRAQFGDFSDCQQRPAETEAGREILATMADYQSNRVRQVHYSFHRHTLRHGPAGSACPVGWRQPDAAEASRLWFAVERDPNMPLCTDVDGVLEGDCGAWYDDDGIQCNENEGAWIERIDDESFRVGCHENSLFVDDPELLALCVPTSGVYGANVPELPIE